MTYNVCNNYSKSKKSKILYVFEKILSLSFVSSTCGHEYEKVI